MLIKVTYEDRSDKQQLVSSETRDSKLTPEVQNNIIGSKEFVLDGEGDDENADNDFNSVDDENGPGDLNEQETIKLLLF
jgi:hypothetical protein